MNSPIDLPTGTLPSQNWPANLALRMRRHLVVKTIGITAFTWLFFIGYFQLLRHPAYPVTVVPLLALDQLIPFQPGALIAYLTLWLYVGFAPALQLTFLGLVVYGLWIGALCVTGLALFYFWPTAVPPLLIDVSAFPGFALLQGVDAAGNACPSMHVAVATFSVIWLDHLLREARAPVALRLLSATWFVAIAYSTLAIKQHVALDAAAGALLGVAFALPSLYWRPGKGQAAAASPAAADIIGSH
jgi:membrane-associated phospholipid phosphatase